MAGLAAEEGRRVLVIGAGPSGLTTAKALTQYTRYEVSVVERGSAIGGVYATPYADARMVSSKFLTAFSDHRLADHPESHLTLVAYREYLCAYAARFGVLRDVRFETEVVSIVRDAAGWAVTVRDSAGTTTTEHYFAVAVCSGLHTHPRRPALNYESFRGTVLHSCDYKEPSLFTGKRVVVVGAGETSFDVAYAAASAGASAVTMSTRRGFVSVPATFGEGIVPLDCIIVNLGTHAWESSWARRVGFHWLITTKFQRLAMFVLSGSSAGWNQWVGHSASLEWSEGRKHVVNKSTRCMPLLNRSAKRRAPWWRLPRLYEYWDSAAAHVGSGVNLLDKQAPARFDADGETLHFSPTTSAPRGATATSVAADVVVLCTGYVQRFPFLPQSAASARDDDARCPTDEDPLPTEHFIVDPTEPTLAYIGFVRPNVGAIPPMSELQALWWIAKLQGKLTGPKSGDDYKLVDRRIDYGVDYGYYMFALAREMNAIPDLWHWFWKRPLVAFVAGFGQAHVPIFRLNGPFAIDQAAEICATELLVPIKMRPLLMNAIFGLNVVFFCSVNGLAELITGGKAQIARFFTKSGKPAKSA